MLFNSIDFALFLPVVFILYWFVTPKYLNLQNLLLVGASYFFYALWDWRFLSLIVFSTVLDFIVGILLDKESNEGKRKLYLFISIAVNLGFLGFFKYYNFFLENFIEVFSLFGMSLRASSLHIILPVGISFYTFQTMSYTIDIYRKNLKPTNDFIAFAAFVSFFPQLVAGPIERATQLLPQFYVRRKFDNENAVSGLRQILWGLFKKVVIADNCAFYANEIFNNYSDYSGSTLVLGAVFFTFQIYCDFSGYSDIAIGTSRLFGFNLMKNFSYPYFSRDIGEFWRRWHISLSTWFRDYLYIPIGGSRGGVWSKIRNIFIIFIVSGFWHGANWTFVIWGALNAIYFLPLMLRENNRRNIGIVASETSLPSFKELMQILFTFSLSVLAWIFFRSDSLVDSFGYLNGIMNINLFSLPNVLPTRVIAFIGVLVVIEWWGRREEFAIDKLHLRMKPYARYIFYYSLLFSILWLGGEEQEFIYFQF
jgi:alginate O-acetyltransferase complex protein AlgI|tara:strand:+ start:787 stop:2223 length:1437 start_codon:yes stop_codon:yes gene_type:complete